MMATIDEIKKSTVDTNNTKPEKDKESDAMQMLDEENKKFKLEQEYKKKQLLLALSLKKIRDLRSNTNA